MDAISLIPTPKIRVIAEVTKVGPARYDSVCHGHPRFAFRIASPVTFHGFQHHWGAKGGALIVGNNGNAYPVFGINHIAWQGAESYVFHKAFEQDGAFDPLLFNTLFPDGTRLQFVQLGGVDLM